MQSLAFLFTVLLTFSQAKTTPQCTQPPPPAAELPHLSDCLNVISGIAAISRLQKNVPQTWSRSPPAELGVQLPVVFSYSGSSNDCEFVVDVMQHFELDIFPTARIAVVAGDIVHACLIGAGEASSTLGSDSVRPRRVVGVTLRKRVSLVDGSSASVDRKLSEVNGTEVLSMDHLPNEAFSIASDE